MRKKLAPPIASCERLDRLRQFIEGRTMQPGERLVSTPLPRMHAIAPRTRALLDSRHLPRDAQRHEKKAPPDRAPRRPLHHMQNDGQHRPRLREAHNIAARPANMARWVFPQEGPSSSSGPPARRQHTPDRGIFSRTAHAGLKFPGWESNPYVDREPAFFDRHFDWSLVRIQE